MKTLDKMTKSDLIALVNNLQTSVIETSTALAQRNADVQRLKADLANLESRRRFEGQCYRAALHDEGEARPISPKRAALEAAKREAMESGRTVRVQF
jgi:hypothetical protein